MPNINSATKCQTKQDMFWTLAKKPWSREAWAWHSVYLIFIVSFFVIIMWMKGETYKAVSPRWKGMKKCNKLLISFVGVYCLVHSLVYSFLSHSCIHGYRNYKQLGKITLKHMGGINTVFCNYRFSCCGPTSLSQVLLISELVCQMIPSFHGDCQPLVKNCESNYCWWDQSQ